MGRWQGTIPGVTQPQGALAEAAILLEEDG